MRLRRARGFRAARHAASFRIFAHERINIGRAYRSASHMPRARDASAPRAAAAFRRFHAALEGGRTLITYDGEPMLHFHMPSFALAMAR